MDKDEKDDDCQQRTADILGQLVTVGSDIMKDKMLRQGIRIIKMGVIAKRREHDNHDDSFDTPIDTDSEYTDRSNNVEDER